MSSSASALLASISTLRHLLHEEKTTVAQLAYVVECIHDPILECYNSPEDRSQQEESGGKPNPPTILTATEHRELFANIYNLFKSHRGIVNKLEEALEDDYESQESGGARGELSPSERDEAHSDVLYKVVELFSSTEMRQYIVEHLKYSVSYSSTIAPRVLALWHRHSPVHSKGGDGIMATANSFIRVSDKRGDFFYRRRLLCFLWWVLGEQLGVPSDPRVVRTRLPDSPSLPPADSPGSPTLKSAASVRAANGRRVSPLDAAKLATSNPVKWDESVIPPTWQGFETLLVLLATPLHSLRRYVHVACCIVNTHCLPRTLRQQLQSNFTTMAKQRMAEEGCMVLNELVRQDTSHISSLIDATGAASADKEKAAAMLPGYSARKFARINRDEDGCRVLVHYGRLTKRYCRGRHERLVFLFNDWFCYGEELVNNQLLLRASLSLDGLKVVEHDNVENGENSFDIVTSKMRFSFIAPTQEQKRQWVDALRNTLRLYERRKRGAQPAHLREGSSGKHGALGGGSGSGVLAPRPMTRLTQNSRLVRQQRLDRIVQGQLSSWRAKSIASGLAPLEKSIGPVAMQEALVAPGSPDVINDDLQLIESPTQLELDHEKGAASVNFTSGERTWDGREEVHVAEDVESDDSADSGLGGGSLAANSQSLSLANPTDALETGDSGRGDVVCGSSGTHVEEQQEQLLHPASSNEEGDRQKDSEGEGEAEDIDEHDEEENENEKSEECQDVDDRKSENEDNEVSIPEESPDDADPPSTTACTDNSDSHEMIPVQCSVDDCPTSCQAEDGGKEEEEEDEGAAQGEHEDKEQKPITPSDRSVHPGDDGDAVERVDVASEAQSDKSERENSTGDSERIL